jgi:CRISPR-associated protein Cas2
MYVLVSYDIVENGTRSKVMKFLKNFGERIQLSVFECDLDKSRYRKMKEGVSGLINKKIDRVRFYPLCRACIDGVIICGFGEIRENEGFELI